MSNKIIDYLDNNDNIEIIINILKKYLLNLDYLCNIIISYIEKMYKWFIGFIVDDIK